MNGIASRSKRLLSTERWRQTSQGLQVVYHHLRRRLHKPEHFYAPFESLVRQTTSNYLSMLHSTFFFHLKIYLFIYLFTSLLFCFILFKITQKSQREFWFFKRSTNRNVNPIFNRLETKFLDFSQIKRSLASRLFGSLNRSQLKSTVNQIIVKSQWTRTVSIVRNGTSNKIRSHSVKLIKTNGTDDV